jgi:hypothetical protein
MLLSSDLSRQILLAYTPHSAHPSTASTVHTRNATVSADRHARTHISTASTACRPVPTSRDTSLNVVQIRAPAQIPQALVMQHREVMRRIVIVPADAADSDRRRAVEAQVRVFPR